MNKITSAIIGLAMTVTIAMAQEQGEDKMDQQSLRLYQVFYLRVNQEMTAANQRLKLELARLVSNNVHQFGFSSVFVKYEMYELAEFLAMIDVLLKQNKKILQDQDNKGILDVIIKQSEYTLDLLYQDQELIFSKIQRYHRLLDSLSQI